MHLIIATTGTRGNVQPYVAVGKELSKRGYRVTVATNEDYRALVESNHLGFRGVCGSYRELFTSPAALRWIETSGNPIRFARGFRRLFEPVAESWINDFDSALDDADAVIVNAVAIAALTALERRTIPRVILFTAPAVPSGNLGMTGLPRIPLLAAWAERTISNIVFDQAWTVGKAAQARFLARHDLSLPPQALWRENIRRGIGHLHLFSEAIVPRPSDWPECAEVTGFCFLDAPKHWQPPSELIDFINSGSPPIYVTYGSQSSMDPATLFLITRNTLRAARQRAVIGIDKNKIKGAKDFDDIFFVNDIPYDWLFPKMSAVVHYGGAGTASAVARAGKPSIVIPFFSDQNFWARRLARLGLSPPPFPKHQLNSSRLSHELLSLLKNPFYARRAGEISRVIRSEDGVSRAADRIEHYLGSFPGKGRS